MGRLFNLDNPVWRFVGKLADAVLLNIIWAVFSIPVITIGASTTALYYVSMKVVQDREGTSLLRDFWKSFKLNFKQATIIWIICLVLIAVLGIDIYYYWGIETQIGSAIAMVFVVLSLLLVMTLHYIFAVQAKFDNPIKKTFMYAALLPLRYIWFTVPMLIISALMLAAVYLYFPAILFGYGTVAFFHSYFLIKIFDRYASEGIEDEIVEPEEIHVVLDESHREHVRLETPPSEAEEETES